MADRSQIEWTDATWNVITGCSRVSRGCENCYAERLAATRLRRHPSRAGLTDANGRWNGEVRFNPQWLDWPLRAQRPRRIFVAAHGDLFHENAPDAWIDSIFAVMALSGRHVFQVLTKRPERMRAYLDVGEGRMAGAIMGWLADGPAAPVPISPQRRFDLLRIADAGRPWFDWPLPNVWLGVSAEDQATADERVPILLDTPAAVRWLSAEPLLGPLDLRQIRLRGELSTLDALAPRRGHMEEFRWPRLDWVVAGGESGPGARPMHPAWARALRDQCSAAEAAFHFKQWGGRSAKSGGRLLDGRTWDGLPEPRGGLAA